MKKQLSNFAFGEALSRDAQIKITGGNREMEGGGTTCSVQCSPLSSQSVSCSNACVAGGAAGENCVMCTGSPETKVCCIVT